MQAAVSYFTRRGALGVLGAAVLSATPALAAVAPTHSIDIEEVSWEVRPGLTVRQLAYGGQIPGKILRMHEGDAVAIRVRNRASKAQSVHWHGLAVAPSVDGVPELGTPSVAPGGEQTYRFVVPPQPGTRWYHSHMAPVLFSGMFGPLIIDPKRSPGNYDREIVLMLHEFGESTPAQGQMEDSYPPGTPSLIVPDKKPEMDMSADPNLNMRDTEYRAYSINGKALGAGDPLRVRLGDRVRFRIINASATRTHRLALSGHRFLVTHLDGNPVAHPVALDTLELGSGERVDAIVEMRNSGVWILGSTVREIREKGAGIVIAYAGATGTPRWLDASDAPFAYPSFAGAAVHSDVAQHFDLVLRKSARGPNAWSINDKIFPDQVARVQLKGSGGYLLRVRNESMMEHPMHLHGNDFRLVAIDGRLMGPLLKDTVTVRPFGSADLWVDAGKARRGSYLFHCHNEQHLLGGMAAVVTYV